VIAMTGTPVENSLSEFWSIMSVVQPNVLGSRTDFGKIFAKPIESDHDQATAAAFRRLTSPFMLRRLKTDRSIISDLPEKITMDRFSHLKAEQAALYKATLERALEEIKKADEEEGEGGGIKRQGAVLKLITALKQICNSPSQFEKTMTDAPDSDKGEMLLDILAECRRADRKVLIFTQYREMGERLQRWIEVNTGRRPEFLHGGVTPKARTEMVDRFQTDRTRRELIVSIKAGGTGLNITAASAVIHYDLWWNPAVEAQATDRAFRIGQKRDVLVYRFVTAGTFEEKINKLLEEKKNLADMTVSSGEGWIGNLSTAEIENLFSLSAPEA